MISTLRWSCIGRALFIVVRVALCERNSDAIRQYMPSSLFSAARDRVRTAQLKPATPIPRAAGGLLPRRRVLHLAVFGCRENQQRGVQGRCRAEQALRLHILDRAGRIGGKRSLSSSLADSVAALFLLAPCTSRSWRGSQGEVCHC